MGGPACEPSAPIGKREPSYEKSKLAQLAQTEQVLAENADCPNRAAC